MDYQALADILYPDVKYTPEYWEQKYPQRELQPGAEVTRFAPSPTGFLHLGGIMTCLVDSVIALKTNGIFYLRIEDTDGKRLVENSIETIIKGFQRYNLNINEGRISPTEDLGAYGPYMQSERVEIYQTYAKLLVQKGLAYPCFCKMEDLAKMREYQEKNKLPIGYYGEFAKCRDLSIDEVKQFLQEGKSFVLRFRCPYNQGDMMKTVDLIRGERTIPANFNDVIIMKSNGIPPYNFAHAVDDHLMRTTLVVRGDEWLPSLSEHLQLFEALGFVPPRYMHISPVQIIDANTHERRKLSKRKDPEADVEYFSKMGYPVQSIIEYLMILINSNFEDWRNANPDKLIREFDFQISKMSESGSLFDIVKLTDVSKNVISRMTAQKAFELLLIWADNNDAEFAKVLRDNKDYYIEILNIDRDIPKPRKDIAMWSEVKDIYDYMFEYGYLPNRGYNAQSIDFGEFDKQIVKSVLQEYPNIYNIEDDQTAWFDKIKDLAEKLGFAREVKLYKKNPEMYPGHCGDISTIIRIALTNRKMTPNLYHICRLLGAEKIKTRFDEILANLDK